MQGSDLVTWGLLIWVGSRILGAGGERAPEGGNPQALAGDCSYGFAADMQSNVTIPYWIRQMSQKDVMPFTFESE